MMSHRLCVLVLYYCIGMAGSTEVFSWIFSRREGVALLSSDESSNKESIAGSAGQCANLCLQTQCTGANYKDGSCELLMGNPLQDTQAVPGSVAIVNPHCLPNPCENGGTCTFGATCTCVGNYVGRYCEKLYVLSLRVDDEGAVYSKGQVLHDTFAIEDGQYGQWWITYKITLNTDVLVLKKWNGGGKGAVEATVNGVRVTGWRCVPFGPSQNPETEYPGSTYPLYDDSAWTDPLKNPYGPGGQLCRAKLTM